MDDYTPLDPAYLPAGLGEDDNKVRIFLTAIIAHNWTKWQKPAKIRFKKKNEIDAIIIMLATVSQIFHTKHAHEMTGNGNCVQLAWTKA